jgi:NADH-quinone oxidoreductase subunit N
VGFLGKFLVFGDLVAKGYIVPAIVGMLMAVVGAAYYFKLLVTIWSAANKPVAVTGTQVLARWSLGLAAVAVVILIAWPNALTRYGISPAVAAISR